MGDLPTAKLTAREILDSAAYVWRVGDPLPDKASFGMSAEAECVAVWNRTLKDEEIKAIMEISGEGLMLLINRPPKDHQQ